ncbi:hypothetical protein BH10PSE18_BH10PSE18_18630 [soil metagenome]
MKGWTDLATELLPQRLQEFVRLIGLAPTMRLVDRFGGLRIYIPATATEDHAFAELIGVENLGKLCQEYSHGGLGLRFELPSATRALNAVRNAQIRSDYQAGKSARELASEHRLHERHIERIVADVQVKDTRQELLDF